MGGTDAWGHMMLLKPIGVSSLMVALAGFLVHAEAFADCPELEQLQRAYFEASQQIPVAIAKTPPWGPPSTPQRALCDSYRRLAEAAKAWVEYARQHDELCRFSGLLPFMELEYSRAVDARDNVCSGRPVRPGFSIFPAERGIRH
jgi:hypothetical protein